MSENKSNMSYWFPILAAVLPPERYPRTELVPGPDGEFGLIQLLDGKKPAGFETFITELDHAAHRVGGYPIFLRNNQSSSKHEWENTCLVTDPTRLGTHVAASLDYWYCVNWFASGGEEMWAVREYLPVTPVVMTAFQGMPIGPERRYRVVNGKVVDHFPYWPVEAFWRPELVLAMLLEEEEESPEPETPPEDLLRKIGSISIEFDEEIAELTALAETAGQALGGEWSIDFMHTEQGWVLIDCALWHESWCPDDTDREYWRQAIALVVGDD